MTRVLAELLGASQPRFSMVLSELERISGGKSTDIQLTAEILQRSQAKIKELGLDPNDTTEQELYKVLEQRLAGDEKIVRKALGVADNAASQDILAAVVTYVENLEINYASFAMKPAVAKRLLKKNPPKKAMKQLNYRSVDSLIKHEAPSQVFVATFLCESMAWRKKFFDTYAKLQPKDFETRDITITLPTAPRWRKISALATANQRHNVVVIKELGSVVVLPIEQELPGLTLASLVLLLNALNDIGSTGSYLKLQQVKPDFGSVVKAVAIAEPMTGAELIDQPVPWRVVHQYYARFKEAFNPVLFEPHIHQSDLQWVHPEAVLAAIDPSLEFWLDTRYTSYRFNDNIVSLNIFDAVINYCNALPFASRITSFSRNSLWHELMVRYLNRENVESAIAGELELQPEFVEAGKSGEWQVASGEN